MHKYSARFVWLMGFIIMLGPSALAQSSDILSVPVRIHDYARLPLESIASAQERVGHLYAAIGVRPAWTEVASDPEGPAMLKRDPQELLIVILSPPMSRRLAVGVHTMGLAAVTRFAGGRVAYIVFDRVSDVATAARTDPADVLGVVMAHELGHLLLPSGSHSPDGLMRPGWRIGDFGSLDRAALTFTSRQARDIRGLLGRMGDRNQTD